MREILAFPHPVNEKAARVVAAVVLITAIFSTTALVLALVAGADTAADVVLGLLVVAAGLESIFGYCLGCKLFALPMRVGLVPESVCVECADISARLTTAR